MFTSRGLNLQPAFAVLQPTSVVVIVGIQPPLNERQRAVQFLSGAIFTGSLSCAVGALDTEIEGAKRILVACTFLFTRALAQPLNMTSKHALAHPVPIPLKAGCASFHHPLLVHGSFANSSSGSRRATVINFVK